MVHIGRIYLTIVKRKQWHHLLVGMAQDDHSIDGIVDSGFIHNNLYLGKRVGSSDGNATKT